MQPRGIVAVIGRDDGDILEICTRHICQAYPSSDQTGWRTQRGKNIALSRSGRIIHDPGTRPDTKTTRTSRAAKYGTSSRARLSLIDTTVCIEMRQHKPHVLIDRIDEFLLIVIRVV